MQMLPDRSKRCAVEEDAVRVDVVGCPNRHYLQNSPTAAIIRESPLDYPAVAARRFGVTERNQAVMYHAGSEMRRHEYQIGSSSYVRRLCSGNGNKRRK